MEKKSLSVFCMPLVAAALTMASCQSDHNDVVDSKKDAYNKDFVSVFGNIDANQTWNEVSQFTVTVNGADGKDVSIYSAHPCNVNAVRYAKGKAGAAITFDAPKGLDSVYVATVGADSVYEYTSVKLTGASTAVNVVSTQNRSTRASYDEDTQEYTFTKEEVLAVSKALPENGDASQLMNNYEFYSTGRMKLYPILSATGGAAEIGYYYYTDDINKRKEVTLISNVQTFNANCEYVKLNYADGTSTTSNFGFVTDHYLTWLKRDFVSLTSKGFDIDAPVGARVGLYVKNGSRFKAYTNANLNAANQQGVKYYSAIKNVDGRYIIGLEDWKTESDCNDIVFYIDPRPVIVPTKPVESKATLAFEDMGAIGDYDFNDVVVEVSTIDDQTLRIDLVAAGGTLPFKLYFNGSVIFDKEADGIKNYAGTIPYTADSTVLRTAFVDKPKNFTLSQASCTSMFKLVVTAESGELANSVVVTPNRTAGEAPQVLVIPEAWEYPKENQKISNKYPKFLNYVKDATVTDWYKN